MMMGHITLENGMESVFFLEESDVDILEKEAAETRVLETRSSYSIADELATEAIPGWINHLKAAVQGRKDETPGAATPRESV